MAARLPIVGGDDGNWGQILNDFLSTTHKSDGTLKDNSVTNSIVADGTITVAKTSSGVQTSLGKADSSVQIGGDIGGSSATPQITATHLSSSLPLSQGGTAATDAVGARTSLGLGAAAVMSTAQIAADAALTNAYGPTAAQMIGAFDRKRDQDMRDVGGIGDGATDNTAAFGSLLVAAKNARRTMPFSLSSDPVGTKTIFLPAGDFVVTSIGSLLGQEAMNVKIWGLRIVGMGAGITNIIFNPSVAGDLCQNDYWLNLQFEGIGFYAAIPGCTFMHSNTTHSAQQYKFIGCSFKNWKYAFYLEGNNNNSEYCFVNCQSSGINADGAFLRIPSSGSDQFLNYWFYGCTYWSTDAPFIWADKGGHFKIYGLDCSAWGDGQTSTQYLFRLNGNNHARGVCTMIVDGLRVEAKSQYGALLFSQWPHGNITFRGVDWSSQASVITYGDIIQISMVNVNGAQLTFKDCCLAGGVNVAFCGNDWTYSHRIIFEDCYWLQKNSPSDVVTYDTSNAGVNSLTTPPVEFRRCRGETATNIFNTTGAAVWDAVVGYRGDTLQSLVLRCVSVRGIYGTPNDGTILRVILPINALITEFQAMSPSGAVGEGDGGSWTLATTDATPTTIASATVSGAMSAGFNVTTTLTIPFQCDTAARAKLTITPSNVGQNNSKALLLIKGYW